MEQFKDVSLDHLQKCSYRFLQQLAKSLNLPSNVKKMYLVEMIYAKKYSTASELARIIRKVKDERKLAKKSETKPIRYKPHLQGSEVSSTNINYSPPINVTPKRNPKIIRYQPEATRTKYKSKQSELPSTSTILTHKTCPSPLKRKTCDRILRSNLTGVKKPNFNPAIVSSPVVNIMKLDNNVPVKKEPFIRIVRPKNQKLLTKLNEPCSLRKVRPVLSTANAVSTVYSQPNETGELEPYSLTQTALTTPVKRQRTLSGIYPITTQDQPSKYWIEFKKTLGIQREDGTSCKINAIIQKAIKEADYTLINNKTVTIPRQQIQYCTPKIKNDNIVRTYAHTNKLISNQNKTLYSKQKNVIVIPSQKKEQIANNKYEPIISTANTNSYVIETKPKQIAVVGSSDRCYNNEKQRDNMQNNNKYPRILSSTSCKIPYIIQKPNSNQTQTVTMNSNEIQYLSDIQLNQNQTAISNVNKIINQTLDTRKTQYINEHPNKSSVINTIRAPYFIQAKSNNNWTSVLDTNKESQEIHLNKIQAKQLSTNIMPRSKNNLVTMLNTNKTPYLNSKGPNNNLNTMPNKNKTPYLNQTRPSNNLNTILNTNTNLYLNETQSNTSPFTFSNERPYLDKTPAILNTHVTPNLNETQSIKHDLNENIEQAFSFNDSSNDSEYFHKKIRAEQVRYQRKMSTHRDVPRYNNEEQLPHINEVFSKFNNIHNRDLTKPIFVQVSSEAEISVNLYAEKLKLGKNMLECYYNYRSELLMSQPMLKVATKAQTKCTYSTPTMSTAVVQQPTSIICTEQFNLSSYEPDNNSEDSSKLYDHEMSQLNESTGTYCDQGISTSKDLGGNVNIPEMVEDALEFISQDGDYMERIGIDVRMQCILCIWTGPRALLEYHIRREHVNKIHKQDKREWNITYTLGSLIGNSLWSCQVIEHDCDLYILSLKYEDPDYLMATLSTLSPETELPKLGSMTIYNKITGEPYTWEGEILQLPINLPYDSNVHCLKLQLSKINLLPNSANITLLNRELILKSPSKVVIGQPDLNDIHIILFIKILN